MWGGVLWLRLSTRLKRERGRVKRMTTIINNYLTENPRMSSAVVGCLLIKKVHNSSTYFERKTE